MTTDNVEVLSQEEVEAAKFAVVTTVPGFVTCADIISKLRAKYAGKVYDVSTPAGLKEAAEARRELREARIALDKKKPEVKKEALDFCAKVEADYKLIRAAVVEYEEIPDALIKTEEARKQKEKEEKEAAERQRIAEIQNKINEIRNIPVLAFGYTADAIASVLATLGANKIGPEFGEFAMDAMKAKAETIEKLTTLHADKVKAEEESARLKAQREEQERLAAGERAKQEAELAEKQRLAAEEAEKLRLEREAFEKEQAEARRIQEEAEAKAKAEREAEEARIRLEREEEERKIREQREAEERKLAEERAELERQKKVLESERKAQEEAAEAERQRIEAERLAALDEAKRNHKKCDCPFCQGV